MPLATPEELLLHPPPPLPGWILRPNKCGFPAATGPLLYTPSQQVIFCKPDSKGGRPGEPYWVSNYGPQTWALVSPYQEILAGGSRGGGKSAMLIAWFAMGYPFLSADDPARYMATLEPSYRGLILRKEYQSMAEFVDEAMEFYGPLGGKPKDDPVVFTFKSGAKIYTNHLGDKNAFDKYKGWGISRIGIEELTQIEEERWYIKLLGSLRAKRQVRIHGQKAFAALPSQIMSTTNPDGPGAPWVKKRFIKIINAQGHEIPWNTPMLDQISGGTRIFIPMSRKENPYLRDNREYESNLLAQDATTRKQWMDGVWTDAGQYFTEWRPEGPIGAEEQQKYPWAKHVIESAELRPFWLRWGGGDWGYQHPSVFHKCCRSDKDGRVHFYDELTLRQCGSFEMGVALANWWLPDMEHLPDKTVSIAFSPDAFSKTDATRTKAEQVADGIKSVLGPYGAFLLKYTDDERTLMAHDPAMARRLFDSRRAESSRGQFCIVLKAANTERVAGWSYMRELMRFRPVVQETQDELKARLMATFDRSGVDAYERELLKIKRTETDALPRLQVWSRCRGLIRCMEEAMQKEDKQEDVQAYNAIEGVGGDDPLDSARYAAMNFKDIEKVVPKSYYVSEKMEHIQSEYEEHNGERLTDQTRLIMVQQTQAALYDAKHPATGGQLYMPRASSNRHRGQSGRRTH